MPIITQWVNCLYLNPLKGRFSIKLLFLTHSFIRHRHDFAGVFLFTLAKGLVQKKVQVSVLSPHEDNLLKDENIEGIAIHRFRYAAQKNEILAYKGNMHELVRQNFRNMVLFIKFLRSFLKATVFLIKKENPDVIHCHWWLPSGVVALVASKVTNKPFILSIHGTDIRLLDHFKLLRPFAKIVFEQAKIIITVSDFLSFKISTHFELLRNKLQTIPMPIEIPPLAHRAAGFKNRLVTVARLSKQKGLHYLIEACSILKRKKIPFELVIIGDGEEYETLKRQVETLQLKEQVKLLGAVIHDRIYHYLNNADIFILPAIDEGFGVAIIEAMACRKPVIATNSGGIPGIVKDGDTGLLVPPRNSDALANAIEKLLTDTDLARRLGDNGYRFVKTKFSKETVALQLLEVYQRTTKNV